MQGGPRAAKYFEGATTLAGRAGPFGVPPPGRSPARRGRGAHGPARACAVSEQLTELGSTSAERRPEALLRLLPGTSECAGRTARLECHAARRCSPRASAHSSQRQAEPEPEPEVQPQWERQPEPELEPEPQPEGWSAIVLRPRRWDS